MPVPYEPNSEMLLVSLLRSVTDVAVATSLPGNAAQWTLGDSGKARLFVTVAAVGGSPEVYVPVRHSVLQVSTWGQVPDSEKTPWGETQAVAGGMFAALYDPELFPFFASWSSYRPAMAGAAYALTELRSAPSNQASHAHVTFDVSMTWKVTG